MATQRGLAGFSVFYDGVDYLGVAVGFTPPVVEPERMRVNQPGHAGPLSVLTGRLSGDLQAMLVMGDTDPRLEALVGSPAASERPLLFVYTGFDSQRVQRTVEHEITGVWARVETDEIGGRNRGGGGGGGEGQQFQQSYRVDVYTWTHRIDGEEVRHVDIESNIHRVNGEDVLEEVRAALQGGGGSLASSAAI